MKFFVKAKATVREMYDGEESAQTVRTAVGSQLLKLHESGGKSLFRYSFWPHGPRSQFTLRTEKSIRKYF